MAKQGFASGGGGILSFMVAIGIGLIFFTYFVVPQLIALATTDVTDLDPAVQAMIIVIGIVVGVGVIIVVIKGAGIHIR